MVVGSIMVDTAYVLCPPRKERSRFSTHGFSKYNVLGTNSTRGNRGIQQGFPLPPPLSTWEFLGNQVSVDYDCKNSVTASQDQDSLPELLRKN